MARRKGSSPVGTVPDQLISSAPIRMCLGCRTRAPATGLLRVVAVDGVITPDPRHRLPGRGAWLHPDPDCLSRAERRTAFPRALRVPGTLDASKVRQHVARTARYGNRPRHEDEGQVDPS